MKIKYWILGLFFLCPTACAGQTLPNPASVPGGIVIVPLTTESEPKPAAFFQKNRVMVMRENGFWQAVLGLPLSLKPGEHKLIAQGPDQAKHFYRFTVGSKKYATQYLTIKNKRQVNPTAEDLKRIKRESALARRAFLTWSEDRTPLLRFDMPVNGRISSTFGLRRFFNNEPRRPHSGLDIAAPIGTPIVAPEAGTIITTGEFFFNGKTIFVDHGQGLISMFNHMSEIDVKPGMQVERGQPIGKIGKTGRVTGPHLHWSVSLNNTRVDPMLLLPMDKVLQKTKGETEPKS